MRHLLEAQHLLHAQDVNAEKQVGHEERGKLSAAPRVFRLYDRGPGCHDLLLLSDTCWLLFFLGLGSTDTPESESELHIGIEAARYAMDWDTHSA